MLKFMIIISLITSMVICASLGDNPEIVRYEYENLPDNGYRYLYETSDGQYKEENGSLKTVGDQQILVVTGRYSYTGDDNELYEVTYTADENGFQPSGSHLPGAEAEGLDFKPQAQVLERVKSDRMIASASIDEDRRRRTIIVEKKNGSYGFTLQSYGIHYKKEHEVEMLTYVDSVEYDGAAYKAGMREGDVILSINGTDMENTDHKTLVNFIKSCDSRMRMVVLFENCVRKVELHIRYIQLQEILQNKMNELERICIKEKELLEGKWKTHSLPARKKVSTEASVESQTSPSELEGTALPFNRPLSTEDVAKLSKQTNPIIPPPAQFILAYQYMDPHQKYIIRSSTLNSSGEYLVSDVSTSSLPPHSHNSNSSVSKTDNNSHSSLTMQQSPSQRVQVVHHHHHHAPEGSSNDVVTSHQHLNEQQSQKISKTRRHYHGRSCNPCVGNLISKHDKNVDKDNTSLDAYDLASPCCDPHCVPVKRRSRHHKDHHHKHKHREKDKERPPRPRSQSHATPQMQTAHIHYADGSLNQDYHANNHFDLSKQLANYCGLRSCNSNNYCQQTSHVSTASYPSSSSFSTDTLWDPKSEPNTCQNYKQQMGTSPFYQPTGSTNHHYVQHYIHPSQVQPMQNSIATTQAYIKPHYNSKPKSWDNLAPGKDCSNYVFGRNAVDNNPSNIRYVASDKNISKGCAPPLPRKAGHAPYGRYSAFANVENYVPAPQQYVQEATITKTTIITTRSTENLMNNAQHNISDECIPQQPSTKQPKSAGHTNCMVCNFSNHSSNAYEGYYSNLTRNNSHGMIPTKTEVTRL
ncbi:CLUMA_CG016210, isoform A [Clunio marinus]|uniref:CLUMA_CG016210, isoform A n=1 Tax=Clunio marinus TaxID=568069 RepID=A0A1J1IWW7_9DIPT|nr:CLUMA_CG016210, isoform A [Clunio marinus]